MTLIRLATLLRQLHHALDLKPPEGTLSRDYENLAVHLLKIDSLVVETPYEAVERDLSGYN